MPETLTICLARPVATLRVVGAAAGHGPTDDAPANHGLPAPPRAELQKAQETEPDQQALAQSCRLVENLAGKLNDLCEQSVARHRAEIARLAVEIARKILASRTSQGDYDMQSVIEEALKRTPTRQQIVVRVNPEDLARCQQLQQDNPEGPFAELSFVADWSVARADCLIETPKGIVKSFIEEHLARIAEALEQTQQP